MNTSSLTGLVVVLAAAIWLGAFVPAWVKRGEKANVVREATRQLKQQAKALKPKTATKRGRFAARANTRPVVAAQQSAPVNYRALYQAALSVAGEYEASQNAQIAEDEGGWVPRHMPAPMHTGHIGTLEQPTLARVSQIKPAASATAPAAPAAQNERPEEAVIGANLDEILRRRRAV
ncbi:MAG: hypothetical protein RJA35_1349 [Actinomycetota bacterium]